MYLFKALLASPENKAVNEIKSFLFSERGRREVLYPYICASFADIAPPLLGNTTEILSVGFLHR